MYSNTKVTWYTLLRKRLESNFVYLKEWHGKYSKVLESNVEYESGEYLQKTKVEASDIKWRIPCMNISLANYEVVSSKVDVG